MIKTIRISSKNKGFTLLELLVAMVIFSLMSLMAYGGLSNVITGNDVINMKVLCFFSIYWIQMQNVNFS